MGLQNSYHPLAGPIWEMPATRAARPILDTVESPKSLALQFSYCSDSVAFSLEQLLLVSTSHKVKCVQISRSD
jgi:hypothetical protein